MAETQSAGDYNIVSFMVHSHRHEKPINIAKHIAEIEIYENIELAYLTGTFNMKDDISIYDGINWNGTEIIDIAFESPNAEGELVAKRFTILEIVDTKKATDNIEGIEIKIIEHNLFNNNMMKINKAYTGTPEQIIKKILKDNLDMDMEKEDMPSVKSAQKTMRFVVPNLSPFKACEIIRSKMSTDAGLPYFLYSNINDKNIQLKSLEEMLRTPSFNSHAPYRFSSSYNQSTASVKSDKNIVNVSAYSSMHKQNTMKLMDAGATAGQHSITDMSTGQTIKYDFDVDNVFADMTQLELIPKGTIPVHHSEYEFNGKKMNEYNTTNVHTCVANDTYDGINNIHQETNTAGFKLGAVNNALRNMLFKTSMNMRVPGKFYLLGVNGTLGRQIDFIYPSNNTIQEGKTDVTASDTEDKIRSGVFIIYTARHHFNNTQHNVDMSCVKLGNRK